MAALNRAFAFAQRDDFAVAVAEDLDLYMARPREILLDEDAAVAEGRLRLARGGFERAFERDAFFDRRASRGRRHLPPPSPESDIQLFLRTRAPTPASAVSIPGTTGTFGSESQDGARRPCRPPLPWPRRTGRRKSARPFRPRARTRAARTEIHSPDESRRRRSRSRRASPHRY